LGKSHAIANEQDDVFRPFFEEICVTNRDIGFVGIDSTANNRGGND
jgi:hypothetical protein